MSEMIADATTMFIKQDMKELKKTTVEELKRFEKEKLFSKADELLSSEKSLLTKPTTTVEAEYLEAVSEDSDNLSLGAGYDDVVSVGVNQDDLPGDEMSQVRDDDMLNKASAMVEADLTTEDSSEAKALFAAADELLNDTSNWDSTNRGTQPTNLTATSAVQPHSWKVNQCLQSITSVVSEINEELKSSEQSSSESFASEEETASVSNQETTLLSTTEEPETEKNESSAASEVETALSNQVSYSQSPSTEIVESELCTLYCELEPSTTVSKPLSTGNEQFPSSAEVEQTTNNDEYYEAEDEGEENTALPPESPNTEFVGLEVLPNTKKVLNIARRTGPHHYTRVLEEHTIYNEDDEVVGVTNISKLVYISGEEFYGPTLEENEGKHTKPNAAEEFYSTETEEDEETSVKNKGENQTKSTNENQFEATTITSELESTKLSEIPEQGSSEEYSSATEKADTIQTHTLSTLSSSAEDITSSNIESTNIQESTEAGGTLNSENTQTLKQALTSEEFKSSNVSPIESSSKVGESPTTNAEVASHLSTLSSSAEDITSSNIESTSIQESTEAGGTLNSENTQIRSESQESTSTTLIASSLETTVSDSTEASIMEGQTVIVLEKDNSTSICELCNMQENQKFSNNSLEASNNTRSDAGTEESNETSKIGSSMSTELTQTVENITPEMSESGFISSTIELSENSYESDATATETQYSNISTINNGSSIESGVEEASISSSLEVGTSGITTSTETGSALEGLSHAESATSSEEAGTSLAANSDESDNTTSTETESSLGGLSHAESATSSEEVGTSLAANSDESDNTTSTDTGSSLEGLSNEESANSSEEAGTSLAANSDESDNTPSTETGSSLEGLSNEESANSSEEAGTSLAANSDESDNTTSTETGSSLEGLSNEESATPLEEAGTSLAANSDESDITTSTETGSSLEGLSNEESANSSEEVGTSLAANSDESDITPSTETESSLQEASDEESATSSLDVGSSLAANSAESDITPSTETGN
ncbi:hypothetical protein D910_02966 [Dendroctonus ponderosae]|uniref:Uncharacterized protein n=1 Tax=Dendroctonus ponderosae TaxID=77166 RepID=U4TXL4_DENPD|nr:hypothetical protein D910_02966 [Dendroctonus ponderosae]